MTYINLRKFGNTANQTYATVALIIILLLFFISEFGVRFAINAASAQLIVYMSSGQTGHAGELLSDALDIWPTHNDLLRLHGIFLWRKGDHAGAVSEFNKVDSPNVNTRFFLAHALYDNGEQEEAITLYRALGAGGYFVDSNPDLVLRIAPFEMDLLYRLGDSAMEKGRENEAANFLRQALSIDSVVSQRSLLAQAFLYEHEQRWADAEKVYKRVIALNPEDPTAYRLLGHMYYLKLGQGKIAVEWYEKAISLPQSCYRSCLFAGSLLLNTDPERALDYYLLSLKLSPFASPHGLIGAGLAQVALGNNSAAIRLFQRAKKQTKEFPPSLTFVIGKAHLQLGEWKPAIDYLRRSLEGGNRGPDVYLLLARAYCIGGRHEEAAAAYRALLEIEPNNPLAISELQAVLNGNHCP